MYLRGLQLCSIHVCLQGTCRGVCTQLVARVYPEAHDSLLLVHTSIYNSEKGHKGYECPTGSCYMKHAAGSWLTQTSKQRESNSVHLDPQ